MITKLCGLVAVAAGALILAPAHAQEGTWAEWSACMDLWADASICGPEPAPEPPLPPDPEPVPPPPPPPPPEPDPVPPPPPPPDPDPVPPPPPPPEPVALPSPWPRIPDVASDAGKLHGQTGIDKAREALLTQGRDEHDRSGSKSRSQRN